jgi:hypothetical protein
MHRSRWLFKGYQDLHSSLESIYEAWRTEWILRGRTTIQSTWLKLANGMKLVLWERSLLPLWGNFDHNRSCYLLIPVVHTLSPLWLSAPVKTNKALKLFHKLKQYQKYFLHKSLRVGHNVWNCLVLKPKVATGVATELGVYPQWRIWMIVRFKDVTSTS